MWGSGCIKQIGGTRHRETEGFLLSTKIGGMAELQLARQDHDFMWLAQNYTPGLIHESVMPDFLCLIYASTFLDALALGMANGHAVAHWFGYMRINADVKMLCTLFTYKYLPKMGQPGSVFNSDKISSSDLFIPRNWKIRGQNHNFLVENVVISLLFDAVHADPCALPFIGAWPSLERTQQHRYTQDRFINKYYHKFKYM